MIINQCKCGGNSMGVEYEIDSDEEVWYYVQCDCCDMRGKSAKSQFDAIERWNEAQNEEACG